MFLDLHNVVAFGLAELVETGTSKLNAREFFHVLRGHALGFALRARRHTGEVKIGQHSSVDDVRVPAVGGEVRGGFVDVREVLEFLPVFTGELQDRADTTGVARAVKGGDFRAGVNGVDRVAFNVVACNPVAGRASSHLDHDDHEIPFVHGVTHVIFTELVASTPGTIRVPVNTGESEFPVGNVLHALLKALSVVLVEPALTVER